MSKHGYVLCLMGSTLAEHAIGKQWKPLLLYTHVYYYPSLEWNVDGFSLTGFHKTFYRRSSVTGRAGLATTRIPRICD